VIERAVDRGVHILRSLPLVGTAVGDELRAGNGEIDAHAIMAAVMLVAMRSLDGDAAGDDAFVERAQLVSMPTDTRFEGVRALNVPKGNPQGEGHGPCRCNARALPFPTGCPHSRFLKANRQAHGPVHDRRFPAG